MTKQTETIPGGFSVEIPDPTIIPVNQRILCITINTKMEKDEKTGIFVPTLTTAVDKAGNYKEIPRFIVAAAADDAKEVIYDKQGQPVKEIKLEPGDEVFPFFPEDAIDFHFPRIRDPQTRYIFTVLHWSELSGYTKSTFKRIAEEE